MSTAKFLRDVSDQWRGTAHLYELDPPLCSYRYVVVSAVDVWQNMLDDLGDDEEMRQSIIDRLGKYAYRVGMGEETYIFGSDAAGAPGDFSELPGSFRGDMDIPRALREAGYEHVETGDIDHTSRKLGGTETP